MQQRSDPLSWFEIFPGNLTVDEFPDGSFRFNVVGDNLGRWGTFHVLMKTTLPESIVAAHQICTAIVAEYPHCKINVEVQTFPDQRADRIEVPGMTNAALVSARLLALLPAHMLTVHDLHSEVTKYVLEEQCKRLGLELEIYKPIDDFIDTLYEVFPDEITPRFDFVVAVDKGAVERAKQVADHFGAGIIYCDKKRVNGKVVGHVFDGTPDWPVRAEQTIWIVDDLCDGGATFISIAKLLRETYEFGDLNLYVTHGLFSKGKRELYQHYNNILARFDYDPIEQHVTKIKEKAVEI